MDYIDFVQKAQRGDPDAFNELVVRFQDMALGYAYSVLHDFHLAQDAVQEAFLEAFCHVSTIREPMAWPSWLRRVVFKHCHRLLRRKQLLTVKLEAAAEVASTEKQADEILIEAETKAQVKAALESLPDEERAITTLFYIYGYPQGDIAEFLEISLDTVKNRLRAARRKLKERMLEMSQKVLRQEAPPLNERFTDVNTLHDACEKGELAKVTNLLQKYPDVLNGADWDMTFHYPAPFGWSPLLVAALNGQTSLVKLLLDMGANPIPYEVSGRYHADDFLDWMEDIRERGHDEAARLIGTAIQERYGPIVDEANVHQAVRERDLERVQSLIAENPERVRQVDMVGNTPLHWAVESGNLDMVRLLVEKGGPVNARRGDRRAPSHVAIFGFHRYWRREEKPEILNYLLENGAEHSLLIVAATGNVERVRELLREDSSRANALDPIGRRPLSCAAEIGHVELVRLLLEHGADPNGGELICQGGYALNIAAFNNHLEVTRLLLEYGANPEHWVDSSGTPIIGAAHRGHSEMMQLLYSYGATTKIQFYAANYRIDVVAEVLKLKPSLASDVLPYQWKYPWDRPQLAMDIMRLAIRYGARFEDESPWKLIHTVLAYPNVARLLFEHGGDPSRPFARMYKATREAVAFLVEECGADVNYRESEDGLTPLAAAASNGQKEIAEYLLSKGALVNPPDTPSWATPLYLAKKNGHTEIVEILQQHGAIA